MNPEIFNAKINGSQFMNMQAYFVFLAIFFLCSWQIFAKKFDQDLAGEIISNAFKIGLLF